jgi:hypothetical protein
MMFNLKLIKSTKNLPSQPHINILHIIIPVNRAQKGFDFFNYSAQMVDTHVMLKNGSHVKWATSVGGEVVW